MGHALFNPQGHSDAKTPDSEKDLIERRELKSAHNERVREYEKFEAQNDLERELSKKRTAQWKKEQAKLTQDFRKLRGERFAQINAEKAKELAARARQKEISAQLKIEESEHRAKLAQRKMEVLYGKEEAQDVDEGLAESKEAQKKPFWEKWLEPKK